MHEVRTSRGNVFTCDAEGAGASSAPADDPASDVAFPFPFTENDCVVYGDTPSGDDTVWEVPC